MICNASIPANVRYLWLTGAGAGLQRTSPGSRSPSSPGNSCIVSVQKGVGTSIVFFLSCRLLGSPVLIHTVSWLLVVLKVSKSIPRKFPLKSKSGEAAVWPKTTPDVRSSSRQGVQLFIAASIALMFLIVPRSRIGHPVFGGEPVWAKH